MKSDRPIDVHQHNRLMLMAQTGSRVYTPLSVDWQPTRKWPAYVRVAIILGGSIIGWGAVIGFVVLVRGALVNP